MSTFARQDPSIIILHSVVALSFFVFGRILERTFQDVNFLYIVEYIAIAPYIILYSMGIIIYIAMVKMLQHK